MSPAATPHAPRPGRSIVRLALIALVLATGLAVAGPVANPAPVHAGTADYMEDLLLRWINDARSSRGLPALKVGWRLEDLAGDRAAAMASKGDLFHASCLSCTLRQRNVSFNYCAEVIAYTSYPWGYEAARQIYLRWKGSSNHWGILMSRTYTRIGLGVAYRSKDRTTYAAGILVR